MNNRAKKYQIFKQSQYCRGLKCLKIKCKLESLNLDVLSQIIGIPWKYFQKKVNLSEYFFGTLEYLF